ncbi:hypothetical protein L3Q82_003420 [Scortum barcoo]|uniref:Uncharacterized protein n=1 Tax=Scortum barcoo TaxID=214431 RepID=A0ACB8VMP8_9TELE|nr:hypothetical protein L3Q82_003420 [Scortum barcoo]
MWDVFSDAHGEDIDSLTHCLIYGLHTLTFCVENTVPTRTVQWSFSNSKPWITPDIKALLKEKRRAFCVWKQRGAEVCAEGTEEDDQEGERLLQEEDGAPAAAEQHLHPPLPRPSLLCCNPHHALCPLSTAPPVPPHPLSRPSVHTYHSPPLTTPQFTPTLSSHLPDTATSHSVLLCHLPPSTPPCSSLLLTTHQVRNALKKNRARKAAGPDGISSRLLKSCADQLCGIFGYTFNLSLKLGRVPQLWKTSCIVPVPKTPHPKELNSYRPVALTCVSSDEDAGETGPGPSLRPLKFSDDSAVVGLITDGDDREYRGLIQDFADWCLRNNLQINAGKTKELVVVDFRRRRHSPPAPVSIQGMDIRHCEVLQVPGCSPK